MLHMRSLLCLIARNYIQIMYVAQIIRFNYYSYVISLARKRDSLQNVILHYGNVHRCQDFKSNVSASTISQSYTTHVYLLTRSAKILFVYPSLCLETAVLENLKVVKESNVFLKKNSCFVAPCSSSLAYHVPCGFVFYVLCVLRNACESDICSWDSAWG